MASYKYGEQGSWRESFACAEPTAPSKDLRVATRWDGEHFFGYVVEREGEKEFWFCAHKNWITFGFSDEEWSAVRELFRRAWELPAVRAAWDALTLECGEL